MFIWKLFGIELLLFTTYHGVNTLQCLKCDDIQHGQDCTELVACGPHEACFHTQIVSENGIILRNLGCRDLHHCSQSIVGKRAETRTGGIVLCDQCCSQPFCQTKLCGDQDYDSDRGIICHNCLMQLSEENCSKIIQCSRDEVCFESLVPTATQSIMRRTGCYGKAACDFSKSQVNFTTDHTAFGQRCWNCCAGDLCNTGCLLPQVPVVTGPCNDTTPNATCTLAHSIVCKDRVKAQHAGCMHHCGFC